MNEKDFSKYLNTLKVEPGSKVSLKKYETDAEHPFMTKEEGQQLLLDQQTELETLQGKLYSDNRYSLLIIVQAMDAAGKDGAIKQVAGGFNPIGLKVTSFKAPTSEELEYGYLWRHAKAVPPRGDIAVWNRSHYENVLITRVNPEFILNENLPDVHSLKDIDDSFWKKRYRQINQFERNLYENGTIILKFFFHVSKEEQKKRFLARIDNPAKNWKFNMDDLKVREQWNDYWNVYEKMFEETSVDDAPWFIIPADDKWFTRVCMNTIILREFSKLKIDYPQSNPTLKKELEAARKLLMNEK